MSPPPPPTATAAGTLAPPRAPARRREEPAIRRPRRGAPAVRRPSPEAGPARVVAGAGAGLAALLARAFSGRRLIFLLGASLIGLVFLQVNLLRINTTMSADVEKAQLLQRDNASKRALIAQMGAGRRIEDAAAGLGMVMPAATEVCYLKVGRKANCPGGLAAVPGDGTGQDGTSDGAAGDTVTPADGGADAVGAPAGGEAGSAPARQEPAAAPEPAPQEPADAGGMAAGPGGGG